MSRTGTNLTTAALGLSAAMALSIGTANAAPQFFTDRASFEAAIANIANVAAAVEDYESFTGEQGSGLGDLIPNGVDVNGITYDFTPHFAGDQLGINGGGSSSGVNALGVTFNTVIDPLGFTDQIDFTFAESHAFGFDLVTGNNFNILSNEVTFSFANETIDGTQAVRDPGNPGFDVFFFGVIDPNATFSSASLAFNAPNTVVGFLDNVTRTVATGPGPGPGPVGVPEPATLALLGAGLLGLGLAWISQTGGAHRGSS